MATKPVPLPEVQRLSPRVIRILGGNPGKFTLQGTNTYLVGTGAQRILIDTGEGRPSWIKALQEVLVEEKAKCNVILTHWHLDHVGGMKDLLELYPNTKIYKHRPDENQQDIVDNQVLRVDGATLRSMYTPGHTSDHMSLILEEEDAIFTGDNVLGQGTAVFEDLKVYLSSLEKMKTAVSGKAYPGHGPVIDDGKSRIIEYIRHRGQREEQVLEVLRSERRSSHTPEEEETASWDSMEIVKIIYWDIPETLHVPAQGGVEQILRKLQQEDKVSEHPLTRKWRIRNHATL